MRERVMVVLHEVAGGWMLESRQAGTAAAGGAAASKRGQCGGGGWINDVEVNE